MFFLYIQCFHWLPERITKAYMHKNVQQWFLMGQKQETKMPESQGLLKLSLAHPHNWTMRHLSLHWYRALSKINHEVKNASSRRMCGVFEILHHMHLLTLQKQCEQYTKLLIECNPIIYARIRKTGKEVWGNISWLCLCRRPLDFFFLLFFCISKFRTMSPSEKWKILKHIYSIIQI